MQLEAWGALTTPLCPQVSDAVYRMVYELAKAQYDAAVARCEQERPQLESTIRTDMDQIITSKEHLASKIRGAALQGCPGMCGCAHSSWGGCSRGAAQPLAPLGVHVLTGIVPGGQGQGGLSLPWHGRGAGVGSGQTRGTLQEFLVFSWKGETPGGVWEQRQLLLPGVGLGCDVKGWKDRGASPSLPCSFPAFVLPKAEVCVRNHVQPYISSILEALMTPTSQGFAEAREVFFKEVTDMNMNVVNEGGLEKLVEVRPAGAPCQPRGDRASPASIPSVDSTGRPRAEKIPPMWGGMSLP